MATCRISAAVICLNEEIDLPSCLDSVGWCDEVVVVVDSKTSDGTAHVAEQRGARVFVRDWDGWAAQKNFAFGQCTGDWILSIDADERVPAELRDEILSIVAGGEPADGYYLPRRNIWMGHWIRHGGWFPDYTLRLFRRGAGECRYLVHERIEVNGPTALLRSPLIHDTVKNLNEHLATAIRYTDAEAQEMLENGVRFYRIFPWRPFLAFVQDFSAGPKTRLRAYLLAKKHFKNRVGIAWLVPFSPFAKFADMYILRQGFRDGRHGFWLAALSATYVAIKYAKYWALSQEARWPAQPP